MRRFTGTLTKHGSIRFYKYLFSYLVLMLVLMLIAGVMHGSVLEALRQEVEQRNLAALSQAARQIDAYFVSLEQISVNIRENANLKPYAVRNDAYEARQAIAELQRYRSLASFLFDIALYYPDQPVDRVYTSDGVYRLDAFFTYAYRFERLDRDTFDTMQRALPNPVVRPIESVQIRSVQTRDLLLCVYPILNTGGLSWGTVSFFVNANEIADILHSALEPYSGWFGILSEQDKLLISGGSVSVSLTPEILATSDATGTRTLTLGGHPVSLLTVPSQQRNWRYVLAIPTQETMAKVLASRRAWNLAFLTAIAAGLLIGAAFSYWHYKPLRAMALRLASPDDAHREGLEDEIDYIGRTVQAIVQQNHGLYAKLQTQQTQVRNQYLLSLLMGGSATPEEAPIPLIQPDARYGVLLFALDHGNAPTHARREIMDQLEDAAGETDDGYALDLLDQSGIALVVLLRNKGNPSKALTDIAGHAFDRLKQTLGASFTLGVGGVCDMPDALPTSFTEARRAVLHRSVWGGGRIIAYDQVRDQQNKAFHYPADLESDLLQAVRQGSATETETACDAVANALSALSPEAAHAVTLGMVGALLKAMNDSGISPDEATQAALNRLMLMDEGATEALGGRLRTLALRLRDTLAALRSSPNRTRIERMETYITAHYRDAALSLESVAAHVGISGPYAATLYKAHTGMSVMQRVDAVRIEEAKRLLVQSNLRLQELIQEIGYVDTTHFIRKFKAAVGVTPGVYRRAQSGQDTL